MPRKQNILQLLDLLAPPLANSFQDTFMRALHTAHAPCRYLQSVISSNPFGPIPKSNLSVREKRKLLNLDRYKFFPNEYWYTCEENAIVWNLEKVNMCNTRSDYTEQCLQLVRSGPVLWSQNKDWSQIWDRSQDQSLRITQSPIHFQCTENKYC